MVLDAGCRVVAFEANVACALAVDAYVCGGPGTAEDVVAGMHFWTWDVDEVVALVRWMRAHNEGRPPEDQPATTVESDD